MATKKIKNPKAVRSTNEVRALILRYFYDRHRCATSPRGKKGFAVKITDIKRELKAAHDLAQTDVVSNLSYLMSQGWIDEERIEKNVPLKSGTVVPQSTSYYKINARGIDKIEGEGEFTMDKFKGINIKAIGQNIITVGDGNQVDAHFEDAAGALVDLKQALLATSSVTEQQKFEAVADIDSIQSQLAKATPSKGVIQAAWEGLKKLDTVLGIADKVSRLAGLLRPFLGG
jgi:hypothetical protein